MLPDHLSRHNNCKRIENYCTWTKIESMCDKIILATVVAVSSEQIVGTDIMAIPIRNVHPPALPSAVLNQPFPWLNVSHPIGGKPGFSKFSSRPTTWGGSQLV